MKYLLSAVIFVVLLRDVYSIPVAGITGKNLIRQRRVTCDLLDFMGNSACAANCLSMGKAGGTCQGGICVCRTDTLSRVIEDRFFPDMKDKDFNFNFDPKPKKNPDNYNGRIPILPED